MKEKFHTKYQTIGRNIKRLRLERKWTQLQLANRCSVNREQVSRIENARRDYMFSTLLEVCDALETDLTEIIN